MILHAIFSNLINGQRVEIRGFGTFNLKYRASRIGRNPKSGKAVQVPAKYVPHFKAGRELRERARAIAARSR
jgi:integration host factor subunit beta